MCSSRPATKHAHGVHGFLYLIRNSVNGKVYVGQTVQPYKTRWKEHRNSKRNKPLYNAFRKYGLANFTFTLLGHAFSQSELDEMEARSICMHDATDREFGYNLRAGGASGGYLLEEHKRKIGAANAISQLGLKRSTESSEKKRQALIGKKHSPELVAKRANAIRGFKHSPETNEATANAI